MQLTVQMVLIAVVGVFLAAFVDGIAGGGPGVSAEDAPHIFDRFYKADKAHTTGQGTGLGLAICKRIIENHGERLELINSDTGAVFEFTLPNSVES